MIRSNDSVVCPNSPLPVAPDRDTKLQRRDFRMIRDACKGFLDIFQVQRAEHLARGVYSGARGACRTASLSYSPQDHTVQLRVAITGPRPFSLEQLLMLLRVQGAAGLAKFSLDDRRDGLALEARSVCQVPRDAGQVMNRVSESLRQILEDDRLQAIVG